ncbi:hypothetical protein ISF_00113 [Cordyceps fumosorosea ARSEF 2679]|uniref:Pre-rRNA processing protein n=1 Tax=Cordyceps fumosorosea (strain ARSEF 2679) TaxID=1081104 RepID=A0A162JSS2_CORFA|nr:hypothetical protein ISF_00113 [Cordyceps fumosorosea ARSEF 2679]OAA73212.1 hypothetical protein ISF_00113 [Cordyceps fumosorosea ARSEF 2679]
MAAPTPTTPTEPVASGGLGDGASHSRRGSEATSNDHITKQPTKSSQKSITQTVKNARTYSIKSFKDNWKWWLLGLLIFLAVLLPIFFKVILPAIVQLIVNQQPLPVLGGDFLFQTPTSMLINLNSSFRSPLPASLQPFKLQLYNRDAPTFTPWLSMKMPQVNINGNTQIHVLDQMQTVTDGDEFVKWFGRFVDQEEVNLDVRADDTTVKLGALASRPVLDKTITFKGLNLHQGIRLTHAQLVLPPEADGTNLRGMLMIPNKSPIAFGIGDYTLDVFAAAGAVNIGHITIRDTVLRPGNNAQALTGVIDIKAILANLGAILASQAAPLADGMIEVTVTGRECRINGERGEYVERVLNHRSLVIHASIATVAADVVGGLIAPQVNLGQGTNDGSSLIDALSSVFSNETLMGSMAGRFNKTRKRSEATQERMLRLGGYI